MEELTSAKTYGEVLFEEYLRSGILDFEFERGLRKVPRRPDYCLERNGTLPLLDVKDFRGEPKDFKGTEQIPKLLIVFHFQ